MSLGQIWHAPIEHQGLVCYELFPYAWLQSSNCGCTKHSATHVYLAQEPQTPMYGVVRKRNQRPVAALVVDLADALAGWQGKRV